MIILLKCNQSFKKILESFLLSCKVVVCVVFYAFTLAYIQPSEEETDVRIANMSLCIFDLSLVFSCASVNHTFYIFQINIKRGREMNHGMAHQSGMFVCLYVSVCCEATLQMYRCLSLTLFLVGNAFPMNPVTFV